MVTHKAYVLFSNVIIDSPDKILGSAKTSSFAGHVELENYVLLAKGQFNEWKKITTEYNP